MRAKAIALLLTLVLASGCAPTDGEAGGNVTDVEDTPIVATVAATVMPATQVPSSAPISPPVETPSPTDDAQRERWLERVKALGLDKLDYTINDKPILTRADMTLDGIKYGDAINKVNAAYGQPLKAETVQWDATGDWYRELTYANGVVAGFLSEDKKNGYSLICMTAAASGIRGPRGINIGDPVQKVIDAFCVEETIDFAAMYENYHSTYLKDDDTIIVLFAEHEYNVVEYDDMAIDFFGRMPPFGKILLENFMPNEDYCIEYAAPWAFESSKDYYEDMVTKDGPSSPGDYVFDIQMWIVYGITDGMVTSIKWDVGAWGE